MRNSQKIAPYGTRTKGWEWRDQLKPEDRVDIFDTQGHWFLGTVLETKVEDGVTKKLYIGFRIYTPDGTKKDAQGRSHEGWSEQYDMWISSYSIRIQR